VIARRHIVHGALIRDRIVMEDTSSDAC